MSGLLTVVDPDTAYDWRRLAREFNAIYIVPAWDDFFRGDVALNVEDGLITARFHGARVQAGEPFVTPMHVDIARRWLVHGGRSALDEIRTPRRHLDVVRAALDDLGLDIPIRRPGGRET